MTGQIEKLLLEIITPDQLFLAKEVEMVVLPSVEGKMGVLKGHEPVIAVLQDGNIQIYENDKIISNIFISSGFTEVTGNGCSILVERAFELEKIDVKKMQEEIDVYKVKLAESVSQKDSVRITKEIEISEAVLAAKLDAVGG